MSTAAELPLARWFVKRRGMNSISIPIHRPSARKCPSARKYRETCHRRSAGTKADMIMASADEKLWSVDPTARVYGLQVILLKRIYVLPWS